MQFATYLHCSVPRVCCKEQNSKTVNVPWAGKNSRFTLLFEGFAIRVLQAARSIEEARKLLGLNWASGRRHQSVCGAERIVTTPSSGQSLPGY